MKTKVFTTLLFLSFSLFAEAQFLEKLADKAVNAAERTVERRVEKESSKKTDEAMDGVFEGNKKKSKKDKKNQKNKAEKSSSNNSSVQKTTNSGALKDVPESYRFSHKMVMEMNAGKQNNLITYWLTPEDGYFGTEQSSQLMIIDVKNEFILMIMEAEKMMMKMSFNTKSLQEQMPLSAQSQDDMKITSLPDKTILGYKCKGYQVSSEDGVSKVWITYDAPIGFMGAFVDTESLAHSGMSIGKNAVMMEIQFEPAKKNKDKFSMICVDFKQENKNINKSEYKSMLGL